MPAHDGAKTFDPFVVGGCIDVCGIARDAAGHGLRLVRAEMNSLASAIYPASTKWFYQVLRYLDDLKIRLVRQASEEREILLLTLVEAPARAGDDRKSTRRDIVRGAIRARMLVTHVRRCVGDIKPIRTADAEHGDPHIGPDLAPGCRTAGTALPEAAQ
ncbi:MAG: hypothetical protein WBA67_17045 [Jannaschia sp.]